MNKTKEFLNQNRISFERYTNFEDYNVLFSTIESKKTADNSIEACKSLIEGIAKTIISQVNIRSMEAKTRFNEHEWKNINLALDKMKSNTAAFSFLFSQAITVLAAYHHACEKEFILGMGNKFCKLIAPIRDHKGDISHGRIAPKAGKSSRTLALLIECMTDILAFHMLEVLSLIDFSTSIELSRDQAIFESFVLKTDEEIVRIDEQERTIREFNDSLDAQYPYEGKTRYSCALYEQYSEDYDIKLQEFKDNKKIQESIDNKEQDEE